MRDIDIKKSLNRPVRFKGEDRYILSGGIIRKDKKTNEFFYQAELLDLRTENSIVYARLSDVEVIK